MDGGHAEHKATQLLEAASTGNGAGAGSTSTAANAVTAAGRKCSCVGHAAMVRRLKPES